MTININATYPLRSDPADVGHPLGRAKDSGGVPGTGTPFSKILLDDFLGSFQAILAEGGIAASGVGDIVGASDIVDAIRAMIADSGLLTTNVQTTAGAGAYVLQLTDVDNLVSMQNAAAQTVTIPVDTTTAFPVGAVITLEQGAAGQTDIVGEGGVTIQSFMGNTALAAQHTTVRLVQKSLNTWLVIGSTDLVALVSGSFGCLNTMSHPIGQSLDVSSIFTASAVFVKPDGTEIYIADSGGFPVTVDQYTMSVPDDLTTATLTASQPFASAQSIVGIGFSTAGDILYLADEAAFGDEDIHQFAIGTAWDITTPGAETTFVIGPSIFDGKPAEDGSRYYVLEVGGVLQEYAMTPPGDIVGMTLTNTFNVNAAVGSGTCESFLVKGSTLYALMNGSAGGDEIFQFDLSAPLDLSAPTLTGGTGLPFNTGTEEATPFGMTANQTSESFYIVGAAETVFKYSTTLQSTCP